MILLFELKKALFNKKGIIILAICLQVIFSLIPQNVEHSYSPEVYRRYVDTYGGKYTKELYEIFAERKQEISDIIDCHESVILKYHNDELSLEEYERHNSEYNLALSEKSTIDYLLLKCEYYNGIHKETTLFYDTDWSDFLTSNSFDFIIAFTILLIIIPVFLNEYVTESRNTIVITSKGKQRTAHAKLVICIILSFAISFIMYGIKIVPLLIGQSGVYGEFPVYNLLGYPFKSDMSMLEYYMADSFIKSIEWSVLAAFICMLSVMIQNSVFVWFIAFVFVVCPALLSGVLTNDMLGYVFSSFFLSKCYSVQTNLFLLLAINVGKFVLYITVTVRLWCSRRFSNS